MTRSPMHTRRAWRGLLSALSLAALAACGGGGSDDGGGGPTGLVPTPPTLGATLFADATVLRPLVAGATWAYGGTTPTGAAYVNDVTQADVSEGVLETATNTFDSGPAAVHLVVRGTSVIQPDAIDIDGDGTNDIDDVIELRSPVQVNDQYVAFDRRIAGALPDADGDGLAETLDLASYSRVIGSDTVTPVGLSAISAVRVDRKVLARVILSKTGTASPTVEVIQAIWYAAGIGIVRQRLNAPSDDGLSREVTDETITGWAGL